MPVKEVLGMIMLGVSAAVLVVLSLWYLCVHPECSRASVFAQTWHIQIPAVVAAWSGIFLIQQSMKETK